jgi:hypothetical protein
MKIVYAADNRLGAAYQVADFIAHSFDEIRVAAYPKSGRFLTHIDWNLDAVKHDRKNLYLLQKDIEKYYPDLVIVDAEPIVATLASQIDLPIIYCSPLHLLDGLNWSRNSRNYSAIFTKIRQKLMKLPQGVVKFIYSPWGDFSDSLCIKDGFEWLRPYHLENNFNDFNENILSLAIVDDPIRRQHFKDILEHCNVSIFEDSIFSDSYQEHLCKIKYFLMDGQTRHLSDAIYNKKYPIIFPDVTDGETLLNALLCCSLRVGKNLNQIELIGRAAAKEINQILSTNLDNEYFQRHSHKQLHERINELWERT